MPDSHDLQALFDRADWARKLLSALGLPKESVLSGKVSSKHRPDHFGPFRVRTDLGASRFGPVYLGHDPSTNARVVIRTFTLPPEWREFGDLSENFEYHAAKNEQGLLERRITMLRDRLDRSVVVDASELATGVIGVGSAVEIEDEDGERMQLEISSVGGVSPDSPVGRALIGRKVGDEVEIEAPRGGLRAKGS